MHPIFSLIFLLILVIALWYYFGRQNHPLDISDLKTSIFDFLTKPLDRMPVQGVSLASVRDTFEVGDWMRLMTGGGGLRTSGDFVEKVEKVEPVKVQNVESTVTEHVSNQIGIGRGRGRGLRTSGEMGGGVGRGVGRGLRTSGEAVGRGRGLRTSNDGTAGGLRTSNGAPPGSTALRTSANGLRTSNGGKKTYTMPISGEREFDSRPEALCCSIIEEIYQKPFKKIRPDFLKNPETGHNLELDCYNDELKIAVEYSGYQHYVYPNRFHRMYDDFIKQVRRDQFKIDVCDTHGIYLITVPYWVPEFKLKEFIVEHLPENIDKLNL